jgi:hypothetical protein
MMSSFTFLAGNLTFTAAGCVLPWGAIKAQLVISQIFLAYFRQWNHITLRGLMISILTINTHIRIVRVKCCCAISVSSDSTALNFSSLIELRRSSTAVFLLRFRTMISSACFSLRRKVFIYSLSLWVAFSWTWLKSQFFSLEWSHKAFHGENNWNILTVSQLTCLIPSSEVPIMWGTGCRNPHFHKVTNHESQHCTFLDRFFYTNPNKYKFLL